MNNIKQLLLMPLVACSLIGYVNVAIAGEKIDKTLSVDTATTVAVENLAGQVRVIGWAKNSVHVEGELDDKAEGLTFEQVGSTINIKVELPNHGSWDSEGSKLTIHMPENLRMDFEGVSSDIRLENLTNSVAVKTISGDINAKGLSQHIELSSVSGNIDSVSLSGKVNLAVVSGDIDDKNSTGRLQLQAVSGEIESNSKASEVYANNVSGNTQLTLAQVNELRLSSVSGDSKVRLTLNNNGMVKASSVSGDVELGFQEGIEGDFRLKASAGGDIVNKITEQKAEEAKYGPSSKLYFQTGNANGSVKASVVSGAIIVK